MIDIRLRSRVADAVVEEVAGRVLVPNSYDIVLTGEAIVRKPDGTLLCVYLPGVLRQYSQDPIVYDVLHGLRSIKTDNRGEASGTMRVRRGEEKRTRAVPVASAIIGAFDPGGPKQYCRLTSWTGHETERFKMLFPYFQAIDAHFKRSVPDRWAKQAAMIEVTRPEWYIPGTVFTTVTVNNSYPTGVHTDKGDFGEGFSTLSVLRRGVYTGGIFVFPQYRVGVDMRDGDLLLLDAHEWHGNTPMHMDENAERISVVTYYRTGMATCGSADEEYEKALEYAERRGGVK